MPLTGTVIITPNHFSQMDHFLAGVYMRRKVQFMAKSQLFGNPILNWIFRNGGVFPVRRGYDDTEAFKTAHTVLERDRAVLMYAEGGRSRSGDLGKPKRGVGKIALETGAPVVPVAIHGSLGVRGWKRLHFPKVTVQYGEPMSFPVKENPSREAQQQVADQVFDHVRAMYVDIEENGAPASCAASGRALPAEPPSPAPAASLLVARVQLLPELRVVPGDDQRVRVGLAVGLQLAQRAAPVVAVGGAGRARARPRSGARCRRRRRARRSRGAAAGRSPSSGRPCGPACRRA